MIAADEDALQCDLAETYGVYDYRSLPLATAARLAAGLRADSRVRSAMAGLREPFSTVLAALCADRLAMIRWMLSEDGAKGRNPPELIAPTLLMEREEPDTGQFESGADFEAWRTARLKVS